MEQLTFEDAVERIVARDPRYPAAAYGFVREALDFTQERLGTPPPGVEIRHVTCRQLLEGLRDFALREFGPMAATVLGEWNIHRSEDFGELVFNLIDNQVFSKTEQDTRTEFQGGFDFDTAFRAPFRPSPRPASVKPPVPGGVR